MKVSFFDFLEVWFLLDVKELSDIQLDKFLSVLEDGISEVKGEMLKRKSKTLIPSSDAN